MIGKQWIDAVLTIHLHLRRCHDGLGKDMKRPTFVLLTVKRFFDPHVLRTVCHIRGFIYSKASILFIRRMFCSERTIAKQQEVWVETVLYLILSWMIQMT